MKGTVLERLWARLIPDPATGCLLWTGAQTGTGYGHMHVGNRLELTHRVAYEMMAGRIPAGLELDHLCRRPLCANPAHLEAVTHQENVRRGNVPLVAGTRQRAQTHCRAGHAYDEANTYLRPPPGRRGCRACNREAVARYKARLARDRIAAQAGAA